MNDKGIVVLGAREHNLKGINVTIPRNKMTVVTGLSGSGKSSLAFNTIYAEGQRRYIESFSVYARNFLEKFKKPDIDSISGLSPSISIEQKSLSFASNSTVGTITEIYDYLRLLYARVGTPRCPEHNTAVIGQSVDTILDWVLRFKNEDRFLILAPVVRGKKGSFFKEIRHWQNLGYIKCFVNSKSFDLEFLPVLTRTKRHYIDLLIDQVIMSSDSSLRIKKSIQTAIELSNGYMKIKTLQPEKEHFLSTVATCPECYFSFDEMEPSHFSFNHVKGACKRCSGSGHISTISTLSDDESDMIEKAYVVCDECKGSRLNIAARNVFINKKSIVDLSLMTLNELKLFFNSDLSLSKRSYEIVKKVLVDLKEKVNTLCEIGVGYLNLLRPARSLSGGEYQRVRLANQLGSSLIGVTYVLDEPSIGLHPRDHHKLLNSLDRLKNRGNTILVVEHDEETILRSDYVVDLGPGAGDHGGEIITIGSPLEIKKTSKGLTGQYLRKEKVAYQNKKRNYKKAQDWLHIRGALANNLKNIDVDIPLGVLVSVTGVSGSGKSSLIMDTLFYHLHNHFYKSQYPTQPYTSIIGAKNLDGVINVTQKPIGRTPRSNPSTYTGLFSFIRELFAQLPESRRRGYKPGRFSFNVKSGRCEHCQGAGQVRVEMHFMADLFTQCEVCIGKRYNSETLAVKYKEQSISDILNMTVLKAKDFFKNHINIQNKLRTLSFVGLDYIRLGQSSPTLSGGEAQRIKLSKELSKTGRRKNLYILDEPTTGLHFEDVKKLIGLLQELVDKGHSVILIEHNLDIIRSSDYIIDLGPDGGEQGGYLVAKGSPSDLKLLGNSATYTYLKNERKK